jgi:hypothetical protein
VRVPQSSWGDQSRATMGAVTCFGALTPRPLPEGEGALWSHFAVPSPFGRGARHASPERATHGGCLTNLRRALTSWHESGLRRCWVARTLYVQVAQRQEVNGINLSSAAAYKLIKGSKQRPLVPSEPGRGSVRATHSSTILCSAQAPVGCCDQRKPHCSRSFLERCTSPRPARPTQAVFRKFGFLLGCPAARDWLVQQCLPKNPRKRGTSKPALAPGVTSE